MVRTEILRRDFGVQAASGLASVVAIGLMLRETVAHATDKLPRALHDPARAKHVIHVFLGGGLSHVDSFDYKPELLKYHDTELPAEFGKVDPFMGKAGRLHGPHYPFRQRGQSGIWMSDLFPCLSGVADELTMIHSMVAETANHIPGIFQANTGFRQMGFPAMGAWLSYGLGSVSDNLPSFVVLPDSRGIPNAAGGTFNWSSGFLPAQHQGVAFQAKGGTPIRDLQPASGLDSAVQYDRRELLHQLNDLHLESRSDSGPLADLLAARIHSYELAARMQDAIPQATDISDETEHTQKLYGLDRAECHDMARNCLVARRLIECGVRTVQLWTGDGVSWDAHEDITGGGYKSHTGESLRVDRPMAGLIQDLRQRGMLDSTLVMITTEFGRTPYAQARQGKVSKGRDHHPQAFTNVLIGAGLKPGFSYGATDMLGYSVVDKPVSTHDLHATVLHLLGIDHERLTFYHNGIQRRLTNVHGRVLYEIMS